MTPFSGVLILVAHHRQELGLGVVGLCRIARQVLRVGRDMVETGVGGDEMLGHLRRQMGGPPARVHEREAQAGTQERHQHARGKNHRRQRVRAVAIGVRAKAEVSRPRPSMKRQPGLPHWSGPGCQVTGGVERGGRARRPVLREGEIEPVFDRVEQARSQGINPHRRIDPPCQGRGTRLGRAEGFAGAVDRENQQEAGNLAIALDDADALRQDRLSRTHGLLGSDAPDVARADIESKHSVVLFLGFDPGHGVNPLVCPRLLDREVRHALLVESRFQLWNVSAPDAFELTRDRRGLRRPMAGLRLNKPTMTRA